MSISVITAISTWAIFRSRTFMMGIHSAPWAIFASSLLLQILTGVILLKSDYRRDHWFTGKDLIWVLHCVILGVTIAPMCYVGGLLVSRAFLASGSIIGGLSLLAFCAPENSFIKWSFPLVCLLGFVFASSVGAFLFPHTTRLGISLFAVYLYGGMLLFCLMLLYDCQRVIREAEVLPFDPDKSDPFDSINASMIIYLNCLNIFIRFVQLVALREVSKRSK